MNKPSALIWLAIVLFLLLPSAAGKFFLDLAGSLILIFLLVPVVLGGVGWVGWKLLQSKLTKCNSCGTTFLNSASECPICGIKSDREINNPYNIPASNATIDIKAEDTK
ncbi:hypothetical protein [Prochlorococcus sp. MIT 1223]|uniref:hypothetical protein n=1 Tax=Prochlorococcus sp. MIT 1223 TaxID=3096217 RepID=UPI002A75673E|nr:hypothetical protein [Prochlorococcus sp. MIT 1223]